MSQIYKISFDGKWFCCLEEKTVLLRRTIDTISFWPWTWSCKLEAIGGIVCRADYSLYWLHPGACDSMKTMKWLLSAAPQCFPTCTYHIIKLMLCFSKQWFVMMEISETKDKSRANTGLRIWPLAIINASNECCRIQHHLKHISPLYRSKICLLGGVVLFFRSNYTCNATGF